MEQEYSLINGVYLKIRDMIAIDGFYALIAGFIITTFVFKLASIVKDSVSEGKGFNAKHFYELGREYIFCIAIISLFPVLLTSLETVLSYGADKFVKSLSSTGAYTGFDVLANVKDALLSDATTKELEDLSWGERFYGFVKSLATIFIDGPFTVAIGSIMSVLYDYITFQFICTRYLSLLLLEIVSPIAIAMYYNPDTRSSFYVWVKNLIGCFFLYPAFVLASVFSDMIVTEYILKTSWPPFFMLCLSVLLKFNMLKTVRSLVHRWI